MLQRVGIAQAILHDPKVVFLDEPMSGLDPVGRREVRDIILELKQQGKTVFFSTHILSDAEMLCDRVGVLVGGKLQGVGSPREMVDVEVQSMEIIFELPKDRPLPSRLSDQAKEAGGRYRIAVSEAEVYAAIEQLRGCDARILSMAPVRPTLEDYFIRLVGRERAATHEQEEVLR
jgi:ABC-2 type transport system ATP-binding protein